MSQEACSKANSGAEAAGRQADKLTQKLVNMPKVCCRLINVTQWCKQVQERRRKGMWMHVIQPNEHDDHERII